MGKKSRKLRSPKYAAKASAFRDTVAKLNGRRVIEIDMNTGEETAQEETVQVITNKEPEQTSVKTAIPTPEPQLQTIQVEEPPVNALKATKTRTTKKTTTKKATTKKTTTRRKRATKKTTSAD